VIFAKAGGLDHRLGFVSVSVWLKRRLRLGKHGSSDESWSYAGRHNLNDRPREWLRKEALLLFQHQLAVGIFEPPQPPQERQAEQVFIDGARRQHHRGDVVHLKVLDLDGVELDGRHPYCAICGSYHRSVVALGGTDAERRRVLRLERDYRGASVDHEIDAAAID